MLKTLTNNKIIFLSVLLFICCRLSSSSQAEEFTSTPSDPLRITSEQLEADKKKGTIIFSGNVVARQADGTIMSDYLVVTYGSDDKLDHVVATGDVRINKKDTVGTCQKATYYPEEKKVVMEGAPRIWKKGDMIMGDLITIFMDNDKTLVEGAKATIYQEKAQGKDLNEEDLPVRGNSAP